MSCTPIPDALRDLLANVATHPRIPADRLGAEQFDVAVGCGWTYECRGRVGSTPSERARLGVAVARAAADLMREWSRQPTERKVLAKPITDAIDVESVEETFSEE